LLGNIASILDPGQKGCVEDALTIQKLTTGGSNSAMLFLANGATVPAGFSAAYTYSVVVNWGDV